MKERKRCLRVPCIAISQGRNHRLYTFAIDGKELHSFAQISRIGRGDDFELIGYQRPEVQSHIAEIRSYLESDNPMLPNAIVIAFDESVQFHKSGPATVNAQPGELEIPIPPDLHAKPGWIVDGQQRSAALRDARIDSFPIFVTAFLTENQHEQREQFILVNSTKPLPKGLLHELLPGTDAVLSRALEQKRIPSGLLHRLNQTPTSPFYQMIKTPTAPDGYIQDNSVLRMLSNSLQDGALYRVSLDVLEGAREMSMFDCVTEFWQCVADAFPGAWKLPPRKSRLSHGVGITSLGYIMDAAYDRHLKSSKPRREVFSDCIEAIRIHCSWTSGFWEFGGGMSRKWNEIQNTPKDCQLVANYLLVTLRQKWH
ncbi:MAG: DGQHR domain-containing protein DpdB [Verrucomicrobiota bacterium]